MEKEWVLQENGLVGFEKDRVLIETCRVDLKNLENELVSNLDELEKQDEKAHGVRTLNMKMLVWIMSW